MVIGRLQLMPLHARGAGCSHKKKRDEPPNAGSHPADAAELRCVWLKMLPYSCLLFPSTGLARTLLVEV
jgi:hypothetical protein